MILDRLRSRDAGLSALRRACRGAIVMPATFALSTEVITNGQVATFAAFGSFSMLLLVDFGGSRIHRLAAQLSLIAAGVVLVTVGTLVSRVGWMSVVAMVTVGFVVLFAAVVSSVLASATTSLLLAFVLPVTIQAPPGVLPDRIAGWLLAGAGSLVAITVLWPTPSRDPLRGAVAEACSRIGELLRAQVTVLPAGTAVETRTAARAAAGEAVAAMRTLFFATPYRPTGLSTAARTLVRLIDEVIWISAVLDDPAPAHHAHVLDPSVRAVKLSAATVLEHAAGLLRGDGTEAGTLQVEMATLQQALFAMEQSLTTALPVARAADPEADLDEFVSSFEPSFRAQELSFAITALGANVLAALAAEQRSWWEQALGRRAPGVSGPIAAAQERAEAHLDRHSTVLQSSIRGALGLGMSVLVADLTGVQHSFWVVLGTLSVLRSNALTTGQTALRGILGTAAGFALGGALVELIGTDHTTLWILLPPAIVLAGLAPAAISFAAGQAAFTITMLILYNLIDPTGWRVGLVRIEDVAIGCLISLGVGILFWPRGAGAALGDALAEAYRDCAGYLRGAVGVALARCDSTQPDEPDAAAEAGRAAAAARRLDDAFRGFLAERGTKHLPLADVTALVTGIAALRLTADAVLSLWERHGNHAPGDRAAARAELEDSGGRVAEWYEQLARALGGAGRVPERLHHDRAADNRLIEAVRRDLTNADGVGTAVAVRMIWTGDHLDAARRLQRTLEQPATAAAAQRAASKLAKVTLSQFVGR